MVEENGYVKGANAMNKKLLGVILLSVSGLVIAIGTVGAQIAQAVILAGFYAGNHTGEVPLGPGSGSIHWIIFVSAAALALGGVYFLVQPSKSM
jgi:hypothetical protein